MRHIVHSDIPPPSIAATYREQPNPVNPREAWGQFDSRELREHLWELQHGLCANCERVLELEPGASTIEHIVPKTANPTVTFQYINLVLCCPNRDTCNLHKKAQHFAGFDVTGRWTQGFVSPTQPRCETSFIYGRDGSIDPSQGADELDTTQTLRILNLNHPPLVTERRDHLSAIDMAISSMGDQSNAILIYICSELELGGLKPFYSAKRQHYTCPS